MSASIKSSVFSALSQVAIAVKAHDAYTSHIAALRTACAGLDRDAVRDALLPHVAAFYKVDVITKSTGRIVLDSEGAKFQAARKAVQRLTADVVGVESARVAPTLLTRTTAAQKAAYKALMDACNGDAKTARAVIKLLSA